MLCLNISSVLVAFPCAASCSLDPAVRGPLFQFHSLPASRTSPSGRRPFASFSTSSPARHVVPQVASNLIPALVLGFSLKLIHYPPPSRGSS
eukprot:3724969-Pleurochrysis_carterae.AAC.2